MVNFLPSSPCIPELPFSLFFLLECQHLLLQSPEGKDGEGPKEEDADDCGVKDCRLDECKAMAGPVVEVGGLRKKANPDYEADQGGCVEDQPGD